MKTELLNKIIAEAKRIFGMTEDATEAELHDRLADASEDLKADLIVNVANQIASYAAGEIERACDLAVERITSAGLSDQIAAQFTIIENRIKALEDADGTKLQEDFNGRFVELREEVGKEIAEVKAAIHRGPQADGDGRVFNTFKPLENAAPIIKAFGAKIPAK